LSLADSVNKKYNSIFYVYLYLDPEDLDPFYVGKGKGKRAWEHLKGNKKSRFINKIKSIYSKGLEPLIIIYAKNLYEEDAFELEKGLIEFYGRKDLGLGNLCNATDGGEGMGGWVPSEETREQMRVAHIGFSYSEESKKAMSIAKKGIPKSEEHKKNMSKDHKGKPHSKERKEALSIACKGVPKGPCSEEHKNAISVANKLWWENKKYKEIK